MKKIFLGIACCFAAVIFNSCLDDDGNSATAEKDYGATYDSIVFSDPTDTVFYDALDSALKSMKIISSLSNYIIVSEKAEVNINSTSYAVALCDEMAVRDYRKKIDSLTRTDLIETAKKLNLPIKNNLPFDSLDHFSTKFGVFDMKENFTPNYLDWYPKSF